MKTNSHRKTFATIDLEAIALNTTLFKQSLAPSCQLMAVVKANGYGHGAVEVAKTALANGATYLGVAFLDEALELREAGINAPFSYLATRHRKHLSKPFYTTLPSAFSNRRWFKLCFDLQIKVAKQSNFI
ncbi:alanine racemase [Bacillus sp. JCM 19046]|nr:alanine racemase [Bacillus sp. JCM 19046]